MFTRTFPILTTPDLKRALGFYLDLLDGRLAYQFPPEGEPGYVGVDLGTSHLGIGHDPDARAGADGQRFALWVYADDVTPPSRGSAAPVSRSWRSRPTSRGANGSPGCTTRTATW